MAQTVGHDAIGNILSFLSFNDSLHAAQTCAMWYEAMLLMPSRQVELTLRHFLLVHRFSSWKAMDAEARKRRYNPSNLPLWINVLRWWDRRNQGHHVGAIRFHDDVHFADKSIRLNELEQLVQKVPQVRSLDLHMYVEDIAEDVWGRVSSNRKIDWKLPGQLRTLHLYFYWDTSDEEELQRVFVFMTQRIIAQCQLLEDLRIVPLGYSRTQISISLEFLKDLTHLHTFALVEEEYSTYTLSRDNEKLLRTLGFTVTDRDNDDGDQHGDVYQRTIPVAVMAE